MSFLPFFYGVGKNDLQQGKIQMEKHIQEVTPHQHPNDIGMNVGRRDLGVIKELLEKRRNGKMKPCIELLLGKINDVVPDFFCRH